MYTWYPRASTIPYEYIQSLLYDHNTEIDLENERKAPEQGKLIKHYIVFKFQDKILCNIKIQ